MSKHKKQHFVPQVYLKAFLDTSRPDNWPEVKPFESGVWLIPSSLIGDPKRRSPKNVMWEGHLYTLVTDDPTKPEIESAFSTIESRYGAIVEEIHNSQPPSQAKFIDLVIFAATLYTRNPVTMNKWQHDVDRLKGVYRMVERSTNGSESDAWEGSDEIGKRSALQHARVLSEIIAPFAFVAVNETGVRFFASDNPATLDHVSPSDLQSFGFPIDMILTQNLPRSRAPFFFVPLTPSHALISCPLLCQISESLWMVPHQGLVSSLNLVTRRHADELIVADTKEPYTEDLRAFLVACDREQERIKSTRTGIEFNTDTHAIWTTAISLRQLGPTAWAFTTEDISALRRAANQNESFETKIYTDGQEVCCIRHARFDSVALDADSESVVGLFLGGKLFFPQP